jgi:hypothetical protein
MVELSPIIRLDTKDTFDVLTALPLDMVVVRFQDLISKRTFQFNKTYFKIISSGGLHSFLNYRGKILLSTVMRDQMVANLKPKHYAEGINSLLPDAYTTLDGETYDGEITLSAKEIERIHRENQDLIALTPKSKPIGLVKGCTRYQIEYHTKMLKTLGIQDFVFHISEFFRKGSPDMIKKAKGFCLIIRKHARTLILYGFGSQKRLLEFSFTDRYVTFNHFVTAKNGMKFVGTKKTKYNCPLNSQIITENFVQMYNNVKSLKLQTHLYQEKLR